MKERPILFSSPMVRAILDGKKTQTRRIIKPQPEYFSPPGVHRKTISPGVHPYIPCPYGQPGDRLWVRETWRILGESPSDTLDMFDRDDVQYRADDDQSYIDKYRPSIHMPRRFSRIDLEITAVRVERLADISKDDAMAEGIVLQPDGGFGLADSTHYNFSDPTDSYCSLWESINGAGSWLSNPWVWVIEFERVKGGAA